MERFVKLSLVLILLFVTTACYPQGMTDKGSVSMSGGLSFSHTKFKSDDKNTSISVIPGFSYFGAHNFEIGINIRYTYSESKSEVVFYDNNIITLTYITRSFGAGPIFTYYFGNGTGKPFIFASYAFNKAWGNSLYSVFGNGTLDDTFHNLIFGGGYLIPITNNTALTPLVQYEIIRYEARSSSDPDFYDRDTFSFGAQFKMFL